MAVPITNMKISHILFELVKPTNQMITINELFNDQNIIASAIDNTYCSGATPNDRLINLKSKPYEIGKWRNYGLSYSTSPFVYESGNDEGGVLLFKFSIPAYSIFITQFNLTASNTNTFPWSGVDSGDIYIYADGISVDENLDPNGGTLYPSGVGTWYGFLKYYPLFFINENGVSKDIFLKIRKSNPWYDYISGGYELDYDNPIYSFAYVSSYHRGNYLYNTIYNNNNGDIALYNTGTKSFTLRVSGGGSGDGRRLYFSVEYDNEPILLTDVITSISAYEHYHATSITRDYTFTLPSESSTTLFVAKFRIDQNEIPIDINYSYRMIQT